MPLRRSWILQETILFDCLKVSPHYLKQKCVAYPMSPAQCLVHNSGRAKSWMSALDHDKPTPPHRPSRKIRGWEGRTSLGRAWYYWNMLCSQGQAAQDAAPNAPGEEFVGEEHVGEADGAHEFVPVPAPYKKILCLSGSTRLVKYYSWMFGVCGSLSMNMQTV